MITPVTMAAALGDKRVGRRMLGITHTHDFINEVFGEDMHAARVASLANGVVGVLQAARLSIHAIGQAYAAVAEIQGKSGIKQIDRLLGNGALGLVETQAKWAAFLVGTSAEVIVALDWTDFDGDDHTTLSAYLMTNHGRATPLAWKTVKKSELKSRRTAHERDMIMQLQDALPESVNVTLLADRAFGNVDHYALLDVLGWDYVIRFRGCIHVEAQDGTTHPAEEWLGPDGRARVVRGAKVTAARSEVGAVVAVRRKQMKDAWYLATSKKDATAEEIIKLYGKRFTIEETFRDTKDLHFGMGLSATHIKSPARRDRLLLLVAIAHTLLTLLGAASEASGLDRTLKANTAKKRTHSLFRQGTYWYSCLTTMREDWFQSLIRAFDNIVRGHAFFAEFFAVK